MCPLTGGSVQPDLTVFPYSWISGCSRSDNRRLSGTRSSAVRFFPSCLRQKTRFWSRHLDFYRRWRPTSDGRGCFYNPANRRKPDDPPEGLSYREQHLRDGTTLHTGGPNTHKTPPRERDTMKHETQSNTRHNRTQNTTKHTDFKQTQQN